MQTSSPRCAGESESRRGSRSCETGDSCCLMKRGTDYARACVACVMWNGACEVFRLIRAHARAPPSSDHTHTYIKRGMQRTLIRDRCMNAPGATLAANVMDAGGLCVPLSGLAARAAAGRTSALGLLLLPRRPRRELVRRCARPPLTKHEGGAALPTSMAGPCSSARSPLTQCCVLASMRSMLARLSRSLTRQRA